MNLSAVPDVPLDGIGFVLLVALLILLGCVFGGWINDD